MSKSDRVLFGAGAIFIGGYFLLLTRQAVHLYFSPDDLMNLYRARFHPLGLLIKGNLLFFRFSPYYRPLAEAWYRSIYFFAGFHPLPYKAVNLAILLANIYLTYNVATRLSNSRAAGALTALLASYHGRSFSLYVDTGFVYDVLCYFFYFLLLAWYLRLRQWARFLRWRELAGCAVLYICALNSKEMAVTLPVTLLLYEVLIHGRAEGWLETRRWSPILLTGTITLLFIIGRVLAPNSLIEIDAYKPIFTWTRFMETSVRFANDLFYSGVWFTPGRLLVLWAAMPAYAIAARSRTLLFAWLFVMIAPLPIAFVLPRAAAQYYIPSFGWALYAGTLIGDLLALLVRRVTARWSPWVWRAATCVVLAGIGLGLYAYENDPTVSNAYGVSVEGEAIHTIADQLRALYPRLPAGARIFVLHDPLPDWNTFFLVRLLYGDESLHIASDKLNPRPTDDQFPSYDHVFSYRGGHLLELQRPWTDGEAPCVVLNAGVPRVSHLDWTLVTRQHPALPGEHLIAQALDLGETNPPVTPGQPFPRDPLAQAINRPEVRVNGRPAAVDGALGWPGEVGVYRLDFRVPPEAPAGLAKLTVTSGGHTGPAVEIPVEAYSALQKRHVPAPAIAMEAGRPQVFHRDWTLVSLLHPARPGEVVITRAVDLGATRPEVSPGSPFPKQPYVDVAAKLEARVDGRPADAPIRIGWPEQINAYRVDIQIPQSTRAGTAKVTLTVNGATGPAVQIPVR